MAKSLTTKDLDDAKFQGEIDLGERSVSNPGLGRTVKLAVLCEVDADLLSVLTDAASKAWIGEQAKLRDKITELEDGDPYVFQLVARNERKRGTVVARDPKIAAWAKTAGVSYETMLARVEVALAAPPPDPEAAARALAMKKNMASVTE